MKKWIGLGLVLLVLSVVGCAQIDGTQTKEAVLEDVTTIRVKIAANAPTSAAVPADPYIWAVGELGAATGGTNDFWSAKAKLVGAYGVAHTVVTSSLTNTSDWGEPGNLNFKFVVTSGTNAPAGGCEINNGGDNFVIGLKFTIFDKGVEKPTANAGVTYICE